MVKEISNFAEFKEETSSGRVLVDTYAVWCGPCQMLSPIVDEFSEENKEIKVIKVNIDMVEEVATTYGIMSIPTLLYFENGKLTNSSVGYCQKEDIKKLCKI